MPSEAQEQNVCVCSCFPNVIKLNFDLNVFVFGTNHMHCQHKSAAYCEYLLEINSRVGLAEFWIFYFELDSLSLSHSDYICIYIYIVISLSNNPRKTIDLGYLLQWICNESKAYIYTYMTVWGIMQSYKLFYWTNWCSMTNSSMEKNVSRLFHQR